VEASQNLNSPDWVPVGSPVIGTGQPLRFEIGPTNSQSYFRIKIAP
jgi:hypothetical protein